MRTQVSPFLDPGPRTRADQLAIIHLSKDNFQPTYLRDIQGTYDGYVEGAVINTRFGSFPHSTLLNVPWGSQIRASRVDTGSRGRKRKRDVADQGSREDEGGPGVGSEECTPVDSDRTTKGLVTASSGFIHVLPPTPEIWTTSLPHRTQVVYTPDYSYVLQRIRARPGSRLIEAGAGSGSFTHAAARAVYSGYPSSGSERRGKVFSFEFHEQRFEKMTKELGDHGLEGIVKLSHRDVYQDGFLVDGKSPGVDAVFLDLPAPWLALPHLSRRKPKDHMGLAGPKVDGDDWVSPLNPQKSVYVCTFSPCIEQVSRTVSAMRKLGWVEIEMVEIANKRISVYREKVGLYFGAERGTVSTPYDVDEALAKLQDIEEKAKEHQLAGGGANGSGGHQTPMDVDVDETELQNGKPVVADFGGDTLRAIEDVKSAARYQTKPWMQGRLVTRPESELKTHTSYLVFAVLPREWTKEDEAAASEKWPCGGEKGVIGSLGKEARREEKKLMLQGKKGRKKALKEAQEKNVEAVEAAETPELPDLQLV